jgi:hypothetical protein
LLKQQVVWAQNGLIEGLLARPASKLLNRLIKPLPKIVTDTHDAASYDFLRISELETIIRVIIFR